MGFQVTNLKITRTVRYGTLGLILLFGISALGNILLHRKASKLNQEKNMQFLIAEKEISEGLATLKKLDAAKIELKDLDSVNAVLTTDIQDRAVKLKKAETRIKNLDGEILSQTGSKKDLTSLKNEKEILLKQINELERQLKWKNEMLTDLQRQADKLPDDIHDLINRAKVLRAVNISIVPSKSRGQYSVIPTLRAKKIKSITINFDLLENVFAEAGNKTITAVLKSQNESSASLNTNFLQNGSNKEVTYNELDIHIKMSIEIKGSLTKGIYVLQLNVDGMPTGSKIISLK